MNGTRARSVLLAVAVALLTLPGGLPSATAAASCQTNHVSLRWGGFPSLVGEFGPVYLYFAVEPAEGTATTPLSIYTTDLGSCPPAPTPAQATYSVSTPPGTSRGATSPADYESRTSNTGPLYDHRQEPTKHSFDITIRADPPIPEPVVEQARAQILVTDGIRDVPQDVPLYIVDSDGLSRTSLESAGPYAQKENLRDVVIPVFRAGDASQPQSVNYNVEGSSAAPASPGTDFTVTSPQPLVFGPDERAKLITLQLRPDGIAEPQEQATVTLTSPGIVDPLDPVSAAVDLIDTAGGVASPTSTLHHPRNRLRYPQDDFRIREIHIFTEKGGGGAVAQAELALRMTRKNGSCAWSNGGKRFSPGSCDNPKWYRSDGQYEPDFFYSRLSRLRPSTGKIRNYTMYSRAIDLSKNVEAELDPGRNANTFEVLPPKKRRAATR